MSLFYKRALLKRLFCKRDYTLQNRQMSPRRAMGWLRLVGSFKIQVSFAESRLFYRAFLQKRSVIWRSLLIVTTPHLQWMAAIHNHGHARAHTYTYTHAYTHSLSHTHTQIRISTHAHTHTRSHSHTHTHTCIHTYTHPHIHTYTHTHKTHTHLLSIFRGFWSTISLSLNILVRPVMMAINFIFFLI